MIPVFPLCDICRWNLVEFLESSLHLLFQSGRPMSFIQTASETMVHIVAGHGHNLMLQIMLSRQKSMPLRLGRAWLEVADKIQIETARLLLTYSTSASEEYLPALTRAAEYGHLDIFQMLLGIFPNINPSTPQSLGNLGNDQDFFWNEWPPLRAAISNGHENIVKLLLKRKADVNPSGWSPLSVAA